MRLSRNDFERPIGWRGIDLGSLRRHASDSVDQLGALPFAEGRDLERSMQELVEKSDSEDVADASADLLSQSNEHLERGGEEQVALAEGVGSRGVEGVFEEAGDHGFVGALDVLAAVAGL